MGVGTVYLVGAGPGDSGLITVKGQRCLKQADAVVYDRLVSPQLLTLAPSDVELYDVGKLPGRHGLSQADINALLIALSHRGLCVVRLKGGDPFVFGRGGEEALALTEARVPWEVVPGLTSAVAVPAYAGITVTQRAAAPAFTVITGHRCAEGSSVNWGTLAQSQGTLVILMGAHTLKAIVRDLTSGGMSADTPVAVIQWGTRAAQRTEVATLETIAEVVEAAGIQSPAVVVVGEAVRTRSRLVWYESLPLMGQRVLVAADTQNEAVDVAKDLEQQGAEAYPLSLEQVATVRWDDIRLLIESILDRLLVKSAGGNKPGVLFRTVLAVDLFMRCCRDAEVDIRRFVGVEFAGANTRVAHHLQHYGLTAQVRNPAGVAEQVHHGASGADEESVQWWTERDVSSWVVEPHRYEFTPFEVQRTSAWMALAQSWADSGGLHTAWSTTGGRILAKAVIDGLTAKCPVLELTVDSGTSEEQEGCAVSQRDPNRRGQ